MNTKLVLEPKNKGEQIDGAVHFILDNEPYYDSLKYTPNRLNACALKLFISGMTGYYANVIRKGLQELESSGTIDYAAPPYDMD